MMYRSLLSVLLMGLLPVSSFSGQPERAFMDIAVSAPTPRTFITGKASPFRHLAGTVSASGILIMDLESAQTLYGVSESVPRPMASLTKLMTALLIVENHGMDERVAIPSAMRETQGNVPTLPAGEHFTVGDLLSALLIASANDAALSLAMFHSGTVDAFVEEMNGRAQELGLRATSYANPTGLDSAAQWSSPRDIGWLAMFALRHPEIRERLGMRGARIRSAEGTIVSLTHTHALLHADTEVVAGKTGTTEDAAQCLVSVVEREGRNYLVVLLRSLQRYDDMRAVLDVFNRVSL